MYDANWAAGFFDAYGEREWNRLTSSPVGEISLYIHNHYLRRFIKPGARVLEIGAGPGRFTQTLAEIGAHVLVSDISPGQLALNRRFAAELGFAAAVEDWQVADITDLSRWASGEFDTVVAYGGPLSYVLDQRDQALNECLRVLRPGGVLLASVMALWGSAHNALPFIQAVPIEVNRRIIAFGDMTPETRSGNQYMHMFRADELRAWLERRGLNILAMSASGVLSPVWGDKLQPIRQDPFWWNELLQMELEACAEPGCLDLGTHLIFVVSRC